MNRHDNEGKDGTSGSRDNPPPAADSEDVNAEDKTFWSKIKMAGKKVYKLLSSHIGLIVLLVAYTFLGAAMFMAIEGPHEEVFKTDINTLRKEFVNQIFANMSTNDTSAQDAATHGTTLMVGDTNFTALLLQYEQGLFRYYKSGMGVNTRGRVWSFWGSLLFCATVYSTIGYGHIAPVTTLGRVITMLYAAMGIPLCLVVMADIGKLLTRGVKFLWSFIRRYYYTGHCRKIRSTKPVKFIGDKIDKVTDKIARRGSYELGDSEVQDPDVEQNGGEEDTDEADFTAYQVDDEFNLPPIVAVLMVIIYTAVGAVCYIQWENWTYLEAFYFIFISISTIGFGDITPEHTKYFLISTFYILLGLSLVAMVITVFMETWRGTISEATKKLNTVTRTIGLSLADLGKSETSLASKKKRSASQTSIQNKDEVNNTDGNNKSNNASNGSPFVTEVREANASGEERGPRGTGRSPHSEWQEYNPQVHGNMQTTALYT